MGDTNGLRGDGEVSTARETGQGAATTDHFRLPLTRGIVERIKAEVPVAALV
jgi:hypothetical protein